MLSGMSFQIINFSHFYLIPLSFMSTFVFGHGPGSKQTSDSKMEYNYGYLFFGYIMAMVMIYILHTINLMLVM